MTNDLNNASEHLGTNTGYSSDNVVSSTFVEIINAFRDEIEGGQGEGSANSDGTLPEVAMFNEKLEGITRDPERDSDGVDAAAVITE